MRKGWGLWLGIFLMFVATGGAVLVILAFGGGGKERGLVVRDEAGQAVSVRFERGPTLELHQSEEQTIGARRGDYPQRLSVRAADGSTLWEREISFEDLSQNSFRVVIGASGIIPTPPQSNG